MSQDYPDFVDPWKAADGRKRYSGTLPISRMPRLLPLLAKPDGEAWFDLNFRRDEQGLACLEIEVRAEVWLVCQRSLAEFAECLQRTSRLVAVTDVSDELALPDHYEGVLAEHGRLAIRDVVEDELLLAMPQVPRSPDTEPVAEMQPAAASKQNTPASQAFAQLGAAWKQARDGQPGRSHAAAGNESETNGGDTEAKRVGAQSGHIED